MTGPVRELVHPAVVALDRIQDLGLLNRLVRPGGVDLVGGLAVQPVVGAAQAESLRADDADMVRSERLAQGARVEGVDALVHHRADADVAFLVGHPGLG